MAAALGLRGCSVASCPLALPFFNASRAAPDTRGKFGPSQERGYLDDRDTLGGARGKY